MRTLPMLLTLVACKGPVADTGPAPDDTGEPCEGEDADGDGSPACADCDDDDPARFPGAIERCDGVDNDCDGAPHPSEVDADGDGVLDCQACDAAGYWQATRDEHDPARLESLIRNLAQVSDCVGGGYSGATAFMFTELDKHGGQVECVYTGRKVAVGDTKPDATNMNTEHSWPQSMGAGDGAPKCDLHHLFPSDADANQKRANHPFDLVTRDVDWSQGGSRLGKTASGETVFEPRPAHRGDVARAMLYFATRWSDSVTSQGWTDFEPRVDRFLEWHEQDPPDAREIARSLAIAEAQGSANPFVVCPDLAERVWR